MLQILIRTIPHSQQRYPTVGDWISQGDGELTVLVSEMGDWRKEALVAVHELIEALLCNSNGVTQERVDQFDVQFEKDRPAGDESEPGDTLIAPYYFEHQIATGVERILAAELGISWSEYEKTIQELNE